MLLAAEAPPAAFTHNAVLLAVIVFQLIVSAIQIFDRNSVKKRQVIFEAEFASKESVSELRGDMKELGQKIDAVKASLTEAGENRREMLEKHIRGLEQSVAALAVAVARLEK